MNIEKPREIAFGALKRHARSGRFIEDLVEEALDRPISKAVDRRLIQELCCGIVRWRRTLDWLIARKIKDRQPDRDIKILLRLGLYQLFWLDRIPDHAAVHETVALARRLGSGHKSRFVNALLRAYVREREETTERLSDLRKSDPSLAYSHPDRLYRIWTKRFGSVKTIRLLEWNNTPPKVFARVNRLRTSSIDLLKLWESEGVTSAAFSADWLRDAQVFEIKSKNQIANLPSFRRGLFYIQDPSTLVAVQLLAPKPGDCILDLCAAPGGKTSLIAQLMRNNGRVIAQDSNQHRLEVLRANCQRLGATCVRAQLTTLESERIGDFDRILVDAPCSNTGVIRRRVDLRWRLTAGEMKRLTKMQASLVELAASQLTSTGTLVYSTCSLETEENQGIVQKFLEQNPDFICDREVALHPVTDRVDGCYAARLRRKTN